MLDPTKAEWNGWKFQKRRVKGVDTFFYAWNVNAIKLVLSAELFKSDFSFFNNLRGVYAWKFWKDVISIWVKFLVGFWDLRTFIAKTRPRNNNRQISIVPIISHTWSMDNGLLMFHVIALKTYDHKCEYALNSSHINILQ